MLPKIFHLHSVIPILLFKYGNIYHCDFFRQNKTHIITIQASKVCFGYEKSIIEYFMCKKDSMVEIQPVQDIDV